MNALWAIKTFVHLQTQNASTLQARIAANARKDFYETKNIAQVCPNMHVTGLPDYFHTF